MKKFTLKNLFLALSFFAFAFLVFLPNLVNAQTGSYDFKTQSGLNAAANTAGYDTGSSATTFEGIISIAIYTIISFVGVIFFILIIYGAFTWMTAQGNDQQVKKATGIIVNSVIGLAVTLSAYAISYFLISYFWK